MLNGAMANIINLIQKRVCEEREKSLEQERPTTTPNTASGPPIPPLKDEKESQQKKECPEKDTSLDRDLPLMIPTKNGLRNTNPSDTDDLFHWVYFI